MSYTPVPNWLIEAMPNMPASVFQVCTVIARQTSGYSDGNGGRREWDRISVSQFQEMTGLSRQGVWKALQEGEGKWFIRRAVGNSFEYKLFNSVERCESKTFNSVERCPEENVQLSRTASCNSVERSAPKSFNSVDPQKKERKKEEKKKGSPPMPLPENPLPTPDDLENGKTRGEYARHRALSKIPNLFPGIDPKLLTRLTNEVKRIRGMASLIDKPGNDELEDKYRKLAADLYEVGYQTPESLCALGQKWKDHAQGFKNPTPHHNQLYEFGVRVKNELATMPSEAESILDFSVEEMFP